jgi:ubiquinone/menaquinone biosynthesis C-methylase UbiE
MGPGKKLANIGCGDGFFTPPAARMAGKDGVVYGVDADGESLKELREKLEKEGLTNVFLFAGDAEGIVPCKSCADIVFFGICLHDFRDPGQVLTNARQILKKGRRCWLTWTGRRNPRPAGRPWTSGSTRGGGFCFDQGGGLRDRIGGRFRP